MAALTSYVDLLDRIIADGIAACYQDYEEGPKLNGAIAGFEACRGKDPIDLSALLAESGRESMMAYSQGEDHYAFWRRKEAEIEWVCNVVSAALMNQGLPVIIPPTARGVMKAAEILGVSE